MSKSDSTGVLAGGLCESSPDGGRDFHVMIPAFKATPSSITRHSAAATAGSADRATPDIRSSADISAGVSGSGHPHVPHEPYKGAVWSKPVRVSGGRNSARSTPRSSKPPSRSISRTSSCLVEGNSSNWGQRGDITIPSQSTISLLSSPTLSSDQKPISVVSPVKTTETPQTDAVGAIGSSAANLTLTGATSGSTTTVAENIFGSPSSTSAVIASATDSITSNAAASASAVEIVESTFEGSTTEALRLEILRLREENRRLHAMRRSSRDTRRSCDSGETSFCVGDLSLSQRTDDGGEEGGGSTEEALRAENEKLRENAKNLNSQLQMQAQVNRDLKKLVIASIGDDLQYRFETISSSRAQLDQEASYLLKSLGETKEELEKASIECDVWKSKFMASRVMVDGLASWKAALQQKQTEMERALNLFMEENENFLGISLATNRNLTQLSASLRRRYPQIGLNDSNDDLPSRETKNEKRNLLDISKENRAIAQSLNFEIEALIKVAEDRNLSNPSFLSNASSALPQVNVERKRVASSASNGKINPTPASSLACQILQTETSPPPKLSNDAIAYLDILFGPEGHPSGFTYKCCENCNGEIKTL